MRAAHTQSLLLQTLRAALIGVVIGGAFGILTALGDIVAHHYDKTTTAPASNGFSVTGALDMACSPAGIVWFTGARVLDRAIVKWPMLTFVFCNAVFWAALVAILLCWPGPACGVLLCILGLWVWLDDELYDWRHRRRNGRPSAAK